MLPNRNLLRILFIVKKKPWKMFLNIFQNSQEKTCSKVSLLMMLQASGRLLLAVSFMPVTVQN